MNSINVDDEVLAELARHAVGFNVTPNDALRSILGLNKAGKQLAAKVGAVVSSASPNRASLQKNAAPEEASKQPDSTLRSFVESDAFLRQGQTINRFLLLLWWAQSRDADGFAKAVLEYRRGNRRYFGKTQEAVENSGAGIKAKPIPKTPFWVLTTLDNKTKRTVIEDIFRTLAYSPADVSLAKDQLPDTEIKRRRNFDLSILDLP